MFERVLPVAVAILLAVVSTAAAQSSIYTAGGSGRSTLESLDRTDETAANALEASALPSVSASGVAGIDFGVLRLEGEALLDGRRSGDSRTLGGDLDGDGDVHTIAGMANLFIDIPTRGPVTPFFGGGLGYAEVVSDLAGTSKTVSVHATDGGIAYQLRAGVAVAVLPMTDLTLGYRFFEARGLGFSQPGAELDAPRAHIAELGIKISF